MTPPMRVRFAPSPTGHLHVGNARTALFNWLLARHTGGTFILRVEDTDVERSTRESEAAILADLRWMGLEWDEGIDRDGTVGPYRQSERMDVYRAHAAHLLDGAQAYYCFCTADQLAADREAMLAQGLAPKYIGRCRGLAPGDAAARVAAGEPAVVRLRVPADREVAFDDIVRGRVAFHTDVIGDPVLMRSDHTPAYNFAVVVDDALMAVTHVVRGEDHISNTPRQVLLYEAFGWTPPAFAHLSLVLGPDHAPLSKRHGATSVAEFRDKGYLPQALTNYLALIGWSPGEGEEIVALDELARRFELRDVGHSAGVFDEAKLAWVNRHYLKALSPDAVVEAALPFLQRQALVVGEPSDAGREWLASVLPPLAASVERLAEIPDRLGAVFAFDVETAWARQEIARELADPSAQRVVLALAEELASAERLITREAFRAMAARVKGRAGVGGRALFHPIRVALTGASEGPELDVLVPAIDRAAGLTAADGLAPVVGCRERAAAFAARLAE